MQALIVAVEYRGPDVAAAGGDSRVGTCEHAYDLQTATLVGHQPDQAPRIAFPAHQRGWNTEPEFARCADCDAAVEHIVRTIVRITFVATNRHL